MNEKKKRRENSKLIFLGVLLTADLLSKWWRRQQGSFVKNQGVAFGFPVGSYFVWLGLVFWVGVKWWRSRKLEWGWLFAGGVANLIDRLWFGAVTDWIKLSLVNLWFNLADLYIIVGAGWLLGKEGASLLGLKHGDKKAV